MSAPEFKLPSVAQGEDFFLELTLDLNGTAVDITDAEFSGAIAVTGGDIVAFVFAVADGPAGKIHMTMPRDTTSAMPPGFHAYDVYMSLSGRVTQLLRGQVQVLRRASA